MDRRLSEFLGRTASIWGVDVPEVINKLSTERKKSVRINSLKARKSTLKELKDSGVELEQITWADTCYKVNKGYTSLSRSPLFNKGEFLLQDAASFVPVLALDPQPRDTILDLCAAPGGKTSHMAAITKNKAHIIANDTSKTRFFKMKQLLDNLGVKAEYKLYDGRYIKTATENLQFTKVLIDAPCSGEAAINPTKANTYEQWSAAKVKRLSRLQQQLITTAFDALTVGGTLVYCTCTIAPEENEKVVANLLKKRSAKLEPITIELEGTMAGLTAWNGKEFGAELAKTVRLLPTDSHEAFYIAKLTKLSDDTDPDKVYF
jgi:tRNA (cytosine49-C5)-methyltransferase